MALLNVIEQALRPRITALPFIERWGGAARRTAVPGSYETPDEQIIRTSEVVPISCAPTAACAPEDRAFWAKLRPNSEYASVAYLEATGPGRLDPASGNGNTVLAYRQDVRLAVWLNLQRLGATACGDDAAMAILALLALQEARARVTPTWAGVPLSVHVRQAEALPQEVQQVFPGYTDAANPRLFIHPYSFFGLGLSCTVLIPQGCICPPEYEPQNCITEW